MRPRASDHILRQIQRLADELQRRWDYSQMTGLIRTEARARSLARGNPREPHGAREADSDASRGVAAPAQGHPAVPCAREGEGTHDRDAGPV